LMTKADLAILSGGSITWEKCVLGLPSLVVEIAANQRGAAAALAANGAHRALGAAHSLDPGSYARALETIGVEELPPMTARAAAICDGAGARRVAASIEELS
jgi:spore coat polysaccharide biosynthesis predicted glycosyltransferase SpsG